MMLGPHTSDARELTDAIFALLAKRADGSSICPSEAARAVFGDQAQWRAAMPLVREVALKLAAQNLLEITQGNKLIDIGTAVGPIRLRLPRAPQRSLR